MKTNTIILLLSLALLYSFRDSQVSNNLSGIWKLHSIEYQTTKVKTLRSEEVTRSSNQMTFTFNDDGYIGTLRGITSTNKVSGNYKLSENNTIQIECFGGTKIAEHGWGKDIWKIIKGAYSYNYNADSLFIHSRYDSTILCLTPSTIEIRPMFDFCK